MRILNSELDELKQEYDLIDCLTYISVFRTLEKNTDKNRAVIIAKLTPETIKYLRGNDNGK